MGGYWDGAEAWATRRDIGTALGYVNPEVAIGKIHARHRDRLDQFSTFTKLVTLDGKERDTVVYSLRGIFEKCRWSTQPKANEVMDKLYDMFLSIIRQPKPKKLSEPKADYSKIVEISLNKRNMSRSEYYSAIVEAANGDMKVVQSEMKVRDSIMKCIK